MQKRALIFSSVLLGSSLAVFAACSGDSGGTPEDAGADSGASIEDSGTQGTDSGPGMDATIGNNDSGMKNDSGSASKMDAGSPSVDSGSPSVDSGSPSMDSGSPSVDSGSPSMDSGSPGMDSGTDTGSPTEDAGFDAGYITLQFDPSGFGSPDAIYWDNANQILYIVDDTNNQVWTYTDSAGFQKYAQVPDSPALTDAGETKLNGVTELADGTLVITRFGYGTGGALYTVSPDGGTTTVPNVPGGERRIEVTVDPSTGVIYSDAFLKPPSSPTVGKVEIVDLANGVTAYATGFGKTVGLLAQNGSVLVSDQTNNVIVAVPTDSSQVADGGATLADGGLFPVYANVSGPDQLSPGPNGSIYTDQFQSSYDGGGPQVRQVWPDGGVTVPYPNVLFTSLSDVAYDSTNSRLFVVDNNGTTVRTIKIFPVAM